jgi:Tol biopolymer transport system component
MLTFEVFWGRLGNALAFAAAPSMLATVALAQGGGGAGPVPAIVFAEQGKKSNVLKLMAVDGAQQTVVLANAGSALPNPGWSADGTEIVFSGTLSGARGIFAVRRDGTNLRIVTPLSWDFSAPACSPLPAPDGRAKILFEDRAPGQSFTDLFLVNADGTGLVNLTNTPEASESHPTWAPGAQRIAARVGHGSPWRTDIVVFDLGAASGSVAITAESNVTDVAGSPLQHVATLSSPDWARTNDRIALCAVDSSGQFDLWVIDLSSPAMPLNLTATAGASEQDPSWSADDTRIVFRRNAGATSSGLFRINADGSGLTSLAAKAGKLPDCSRQ